MPETPKMFRPHHAVLIDTETDGVDQDVCRMLQVAAVVVDVATGTRVAALELMCRADTNEAYEINRLPVEALSSPARFRSDEVGLELACWLRTHAPGPRVLVAYNATFDATVLRRHVPVRAFDEDEPALAWDIEETWVCAMEGIRWPGIRGRRMSQVALALHYGCGVARAHGALDDTMTLAHVFERLVELGHDLGALLQDAQMPVRMVAAEVGFANNHLARAAGFRWNAPARRWERRARIDEVFEGFRVHEVRGAL